MKKMQHGIKTQKQLCISFFHHIYFKQLSEMWRTALLILTSALKKSCSSPFHYTRTTLCISDMENKAVCPNSRSHHSRYYTGCCDFTWPFHLSSDKLAHDDKCLRRKKKTSSCELLWNKMNTNTKTPHFHMSWLNFYNKYLNNNNKTSRIDHVTEKHCRPLEISLNCSCTINYSVIKSNSSQDYSK